MSKLIIVVALVCCVCATAQISPLLSFNVSHSTTAISLIAHTPCVGGVNGSTTAAMDTTGANFLVMYVSSAHGVVPSISDNLSNTWIPLNSQSSAGVVDGRMFYAKNATVGASHTFNNTSTASSSAICVAAFSNVNTSAPFDQQSGNSNGFALTLQPGALTPAANNSLVVTGASGAAGAPTVNAPFTLTDNIALTGSVTNYSDALAYSIQTAATSANPTWTQSAATTLNVGMGVFKQ